uniref:Reverse transcriptase domain-containing protein n=1 Tax=Amphimedon queenslandica TaxID=400682 RepID=A0A1X7VCK7_AMPQE
MTVTVGALESRECETNLCIIGWIAAHLGISLAEDKCTPSSTCMVFLGIEVDSVERELYLTQEKLDGICQLLAQWPSATCGKGYSARECFLAVVESPDFWQPPLSPNSPDQVF